jgi:hypothetical protein
MQEPHFMVRYLETLLSTHTFQEIIVQNFKNSSRKQKSHLTAFRKLGSILLQKKYLWGDQNQGKSK